MQETLDLGHPDVSEKSAALKMGDLIAAFGRTGIVVSTFEHCSGRVPLLAKDVDDGAEFMPFADECTLVERDDREMTHRIAKVARAYATADPCSDGGKTRTSRTAQATQPDGN